MNELLVEILSVGSSIRFIINGDGGLALDTPCEATFLGDVQVVAGLHASIEGQVGGPIGATLADCKRRDKACQPGRSCHVWGVPGSLENAGFDLRGIASGRSTSPEIVTEIPWQLNELRHGSDQLLDCVHAFLERS